MERAALYVRVSSTAQVEHGVSLDAQETKLRQYAAFRDLDIVAVLKDEAVSGSKPLADRPPGAQLICMLAAGEVTHVITMKIDRLFRSAIDALTVTKRWNKSNVSLHVVDYGGAALDTASPFGKYFFTNMVAIAELEREMIAERTRTALAHKKSKREVYGEVPYGYRREGNRLRPCAREMDTVRKMHALAQAGMGVRRIADRLNADGTPSKKGRKWSKSVVYDILKNDLYSELTA
jgi:site-specific DNA recombinase